MTILLRNLGRLAMVGILALLVLSALVRIVSASLEPSHDDEPRTLPETGLLCPPSDEVDDLLRHIAARSAELDEREVAVAMREQDMRVAGQEIRAAMDELQAAQDTLSARMALSDTASEEDVVRLVAVYEGMKPKDAAALFAAMEPRFAAGFLARMRPEAASAVFTDLAPDKAYALSAIIAGRNANAAREGDE
jgi:flagellar motility protein MotE (MotC chaperone)